jgi:predicted  nucleic acid-binding Zn-ribbon protein
MALIAADIIARISKVERQPSMVDLPKVSLSFGELAEQIADLSVKVKFGDGSSRDLEFRQDYLKDEWYNLIKNNKLLSSLQVEIEQASHQIAEAERKLRAREEAGNLDREMLGLVREIGSLKQKREDRARRVDAIAGAELSPSVSPSETAKPVRSGNKKKA